MSQPGSMAAALKIGQRLQGLLGTYTILKSLHSNVWTASDANAGTVIVKMAPVKRLHNERKILKMFQVRPYIRPLLDQIQEPPALILRFLYEKLLKASNMRRLERPEIKFVARGVLEALSVFHEAGYVHTDLKPDNILVNYGNRPNQFSEVELGDCADAYRVSANADPFEEGYVIRAVIFRSLELISLIWGQNWHIFIPEGYSVDDPDYPTWVLVKQASIFGPFPPSYIDTADEERQGILAVINNYINENGLRKPFSMAEDAELTVADRNFICKIMKMDPRDRPTAKELLEDPWFN